MVFRCFLSSTFRCNSVLKHGRSGVFVLAFSTTGFNLKSTDEDKHRGDESHVLSLLADVLPISGNGLIGANSSSNCVEFSCRNSVDDFLPPEDKLRGVFLQKLCGKAAVVNALNGVNVELDDELFSKVVSSGNLCGESITLFYDWAIEQHNVSNDVNVHNIVLKALGRRKFFVHMMEMLKNMKNRAVSPNLETVRIVMDSYLRAGQVSKSIKIFGELEEYGLECNKETLGIALKCLCHRSYVGNACLLLNKMRAKIPCDSSMYNIIIGGWSKLGRISEIEKFLKVMVDGGVEPDCITYSYVIEGFGRACRVDDALKIFEYLEEKGNALSTEVYNAMIFTCVANDNTERGLRYYAEMQRNGFEPNVDTYSKIIKHFLKARRVSDAIEMLDDMLNRGIMPTSGTVTAFIEPLCRYGPPHAALMVYKKARKAGCLISLPAYKLLLMRLSRFGKFGMLLSIWKEMQESGCSSDMEVYEYIINCLCNIGMLESAVQVMEECICKGLFPGRIICSKLNNKLMDANKVEMAYKLFLKLRKARVNENARRYWRAKGWHF